LSEKQALGMLVIRHKVKDYSTWRPEFDRHASTQRSAGLTNPRVFHSSDDPNEVVIFFTTNDTAKAKDFVASLLAGAEGVGPIQVLMPKQSL
jgi:hypothetical protein